MEATQEEWQCPHRNKLLFPGGHLRDEVQHHHDDHQSSFYRKVNNHWNMSITVPYWSFRFYLIYVFPEERDGMGSFLFLCAKRPLEKKTNTQIHKWMIECICKYISLQSIQLTLDPVSSIPSWLLIFGLWFSLALIFLKKGATCISSWRSELCPKLRLELCYLCYLLSARYPWISPSSREAVIGLPQWNSPDTWCGI